LEWSWEKKYYAQNRRPLPLVYFAVVPAREALCFFFFLPSLALFSLFLFFSPHLLRLPFFFLFDFLSRILSRELELGSVTSRNHCVAGVVVFCEGEKMATSVS
jgi:hypothetical protein